VSPCYPLYGFYIKSCDFLPGLIPTPTVFREIERQIELTTKHEPVWAQRARSLPSELMHWRGNGRDSHNYNFAVSELGRGAAFALSYSDGTLFVIDRAAERIWGKWEDPWTIEDFTTYLVGPVTGFMLRRRGVLTLHASGIATHNAAVLFCGGAGAGKSTLAAALALKGFPVLCEDIAALRSEGGAFWVAPGYPRVCLWPESVGRLSGNPDQFPLITPNWDKRYLPLDGNLAHFCSEPLRVCAIYVLQARDNSERAPSVSELGAKDALPLLVQNTYMNYLLDRAQRAQEFEQLAQLVANVPVRRVIPHTDFDRVEELCRLIVSDTEKIASRKAVAPSTI
jgi:hypothetical protein